MNSSSDLLSFSSELVFPQTFFGFQIRMLEVPTSSVASIMSMKEFCSFFYLSIALVFLLLEALSARNLFLSSSPPTQSCTFPAINSSLCKQLNFFSDFRNTIRFHLFRFIPPLLFSSSCLFMD
ncbi:hypothetical protein Tco_0632984 [Tanacetum coccineum]